MTIINNNPGGDEVVSTVLAMALVREFAADEERKLEIKSLKDELADLRAVLEKLEGKRPAHPEFLEGVEAYNTAPKGTQVGTREGHLEAIGHGQWAEGGQTWNPGDLSSARRVIRWGGGS